MHFWIAQRIQFNQAPVSMQRTHFLSSTSKLLERTLIGSPHAIPLWLNIRVRLQEYDWLCLS